MKPSEYLDKCKIALGVRTDYALAKRLELHTALISDYYKGKRWPDAYACTRIALALKLDPFEVLADVESQHAKTEEKRAFWRGFIGRTGKAAAGLLLALSLWTCYVDAPPAFASLGSAAAASAALLILTNRRLRIMYIMLNILQGKDARFSPGSGLLFAFEPLHGKPDKFG